MDETKTGEPLELPITRQLLEIFERRRADLEDADGWVFPSSMSGTGHLGGIHQYYEEIGRAGGTKFWFHEPRNVFITVAERELMLSRSLTKRLVNHARDDDMIAGLDPARRRKIEDRAAELIAEEMTLRELRKARQLTQVSVARALGINQDAVSRLEQRSDLLLSTLRKTVEAMGGSLSLLARFPDRPPVELSGIAERQSRD